MSTTMQEEINALEAEIGGYSGVGYSRWEEGLLGRLCHRQGE